MEKIKKMSKADIILRLNDDKEYYGKFGKQFLSYSFIGDLINNPAGIMAEHEETNYFMYGKAFHEIMMFGETQYNNYVDCSTRSTKIYKQALLDNKCDVLLLKKEYDDIVSLVESGKSNKDVKEIFDDTSIKFEVPNVSVMTTNNIMWKCKADIETNDFIYDIKTTSNINSFRKSSSIYNYDAQAYLYSFMFQKEMKFIVFDKNTGVVGIMDVSDETYERGREKVEQAEEQYLDYFVNKTKELKDHTIYGTI